MAPPPGLVVRAATGADVPGLCELANDPGYRWGTLRLPYQTIEQTGRWLTGLGADDHLLVAELDGAVVGNAGLHRQRGRRNHVGMLGMGVRDAVGAAGSARPCWPRWWISPTTGSASPVWSCRSSPTTSPR